MGLHNQLRLIEPAAPVIALIGGRLALVGEFDMGAAMPGLDPAGGVTVDLGLNVPPCSCTDPERDVDLDCRQCFPEAPADLLELIARAISAGRRWELGAGPVIDGVDPMDVNAARAVVEVLVKPTTHGVFK